jgi:hypothetical protein
MLPTANLRIALIPGNNAICETRRAATYPGMRDAATRRGRRAGAVRAEIPGREN